MPSLSDTIAASDAISGYTRSDPAAQTPRTAPASGSMEPTRNSMIRCPLPPLWQGAPDSLRQFYVGGRVPQFRVMTPNAVPNSSSQQTVVIGTGGNGGGNSAGSGGGSIIPPPPPAPPSTNPAVQTFLRTGVLLPGGQYIGTISLASSFQLLAIASDSAVRVELYGSASAQTQDLARGLDVPPAAGVTQGIISDLALDTYPYQWSFQNRLGSNSDSPQSRLIYLTITNIGSSSVAAGITIQYVPIEK